VLFQIALIFDKMSSAACSPFQRQNTPPFLNVRYVKTIADTYTLIVNLFTYALVHLKAVYVMH
ncbi:MAG: hypothetical protein M1429_03630, partial [Patescibacteria group bacterium]|nr:hypothetical protein [Patescibacteria group bacterium]